MAKLELTDANLTEKVLAIQQALKAPKNQKNSFGNYNYRSCEDILEAVKPLLVDHRVLMTINDDLVQVGDRYYVKATVIVFDADDVMKWFEVSAFAREAEAKKGMDESQITGAASSYARKYALNGMFCIDDTKDADTMDNSAKKSAKVTTTPKIDADKVNEVMGSDNVATGKQIIVIKNLLRQLDVTGDKRDDIVAQATTSQKASELIKQLMEKVQKKQEAEGTIDE